MTEQAKAPPAFQFYASDTMADRRYRYMNFSERGLLLSILCECWVNRSAPADIDSLAKVLGFSRNEVGAALTEGVLSFFTVQEGELINTGLAEYRQKLDLGKANMAKGGKKGAQARWGKTATSDGHPINRPNSHPINPPNGVLMGARVETSRAELSRRYIEDNKDITFVDPWIAAYDAYGSHLDARNVDF